MKNKKKIVVLVVQLLALIVFIFSYKSYTDAIVKPIKVYSYARSMSEGVKITEKDLVETNVATNTYKQNMVLTSDISSIVGRYTTTKVFAGNICYIEQVGDLNETDKGFVSLDLTNSRLMSIPVDLTTDVGGFLSAGDRIDLMFSGAGTSTIVNINQTSGEDANNETNGGGTDESFYYAKVFLQDIVVYEVLNGSGYKYAERATRYEGEAAKNLDISNPEEVNVDSGNIKTVLIIVTPEQAEQIKVRMSVGTVNILKRFDESETHDTLGYVLGNYGKVFSGNANAETGSLQIISTIQDTDNDDETLLESNNNEKNNSIVTTGNSENTNNSTQDSSSEQSNIGVAIGGSSVE